MDLSVVVSAREDDRTRRESLAVASSADRLGYPELWVGEGPTWDAFVLATAIGLGTRQIALTAGPVPVSVRDPATIARAAESVAAVTGRPVGVALGTSSVRVVEGLHGRSRAGAVTTMAATARALAGWRSSPGAGPLTVAAFGDRAIAIAAEHADRMVLDLVSPDQVRALRAKLAGRAHRFGRKPPRLAAWLPAAIDPGPLAHTQLLDGIVRYLTVRGYAEMFVAAGFGAAVELARSGAGQAELRAALPLDAAGTVGLVGDVAAVEARLRDYADAGLDEIGLVPATDGDPGADHTLTVLSSSLSR
ncbi:MAG TPA: LLM class flavin-dependent oxidoreductase [Pseudonocardiaceae bacterium]|jgi:alkanesulfonate monooxygenase SsuD/methylene tetrahydromethanopterin reductase-like flavin-dependent oxidoreductase (luciferase family)|nr:LLM class flavin-dependent oxidoreductase [Pseudonocardiaceae bacterium]